MTVTLNPIISSGMVSFKDDLFISPKMTLKYATSLDYFDRKFVTSITMAHFYLLLAFKLKAAAAAVGPLWSSKVPRMMPHTRCLLIW